MVKFADAIAGDTPAQTRASRGPHNITLEDGDMGPAIRAMTPYLSWSTGPALAGMDGSALEGASDTCREGGPVGAAAARAWA